MSSIVTFYSYKGGVGRSMALANIAVLLARRGLKVFVVDWDLEAPGLERYFSYFEIAPGGPGLLRMFLDARSGQAVDYAQYTAAVHCATTHPITLLASGREHDDMYSRNLEAFSWEGFFTAHGGAFIENLRRRWREEFDIVLIDSRTGLSDTGGICTIQLPDIVVAMFTANYQSLYGVRDVMRLAQRARQTLAYDRMPLSVLPLPARWGVQEFVETQFWLDRVKEAVREFYEDWLPRTMDPREVIERIKVPQADYFGFGEKLAVVEQGTSNPQGMGFVYDKIASFLVSDFKDLEALVGADVVQRESSLSAEAAKPATPGVGRPDDAGYAYDVFVSFPRAVTQTVLDVVEALKPHLEAAYGHPARIFVDVRELEVGEALRDEVDHALLHSKVLLAFLTPAYATTRSLAKEFRTFADRAYRTNARVIVPTIVRGERFPRWINEWDPLDVREDLHVATRTGPSAARWHQATMKIADRLKHAILTAPPFDPTWHVIAPSDERPAPS